MHYDPVQYVEFFHLAFLDQLARKLDHRLYALKGGCNLRFFLGSIRYSQDIDLDVKTVAVSTLQRGVNGILKGAALRIFLGIHSLEIVQFAEPKQTETTQRWKVQLKGPAGIIFPTKIEFSRRGLDSPVEQGPILSTVLSAYHLHPIMVSHYGPKIAFEQKVKALALRTETQARDIWDLFHLINAYEVKEIHKVHLDQACMNACNIQFSDFKDQVLAFLPVGLQEQYTPELWDQVQLAVLTYLESLR